MASDTRGGGGCCEGSPSGFNFERESTCEDAVVYESGEETRRGDDFYRGQGAKFGASNPVGFQGNCGYGPGAKGIVLANCMQHSKLLSVRS